MLGLIVLLQALTLVVSGPPSSPEYLPVHVAEAEGLFAREGLAVSVKTTRAEPAAAEALAQGQADVAATSVDAILRFGPRGGGQAARLVFGLTAAPPVALLAPASRADLRSIADLAGRPVGVSLPGAPELAWFARLLAGARLGLAEVRLVSLGTAGVVEAVESGDVFAALVPEPAASRLLDEGRARLLADLRTPTAVAQALGGVTVNAAVFTRGGHVSDGDAVRLGRALLAAEARIAEASSETLAGRLPRRVTGRADEFAERVAAARRGYLPDGLVTREQVERTIALVRAHVPLPATGPVPKARDLAHTEPLRRALTAPAPR